MVICIVPISSCHNPRTEMTLVARAVAFLLISLVTCSQLVHGLLGRGKVAQLFCTQRFGRIC